MRAIRVDEFGGPSVLRPVELPTPVPGPGEVLVGVEVAGVLFLDTLIRRGGAPAFGITPPYVPGRGAAGGVLAVGPDVEPSWVGRRVLVDGPGTYAAEVAAPVPSLVPVPDGLDLADAMALLHDGGTALALVGAVGVRPGETVLVLPAAGGAGSVLVQLARRSGARVVGAARGRKLGLVRSLGADLAVDYGEPGWADAVRRRVGQVDVVFDGVGGTLGAEAFGLVAEGGRYSGYGTAGGAPVTRSTPDVEVRGVAQLADFADGRRARQERVLAEAAAGRLHPVVGREFPLEKAADAHAALENREIAGKALLLP
ncbi:zinc-binding dehydrogenase [Pseudonocardia oroxyli]|uniref:NADPH2:quinone reductase n=1 Tax=Pseudonocardia oroxyli TaxID=366584 RepID=A0A1G7UMI4_PSEOR|nr:zinc-binding dehydrogenase [Pseudonocardia oroxyli]SDG48713.1 NADPH2:quinone reductase [Pseudonocardia oroxyli]